MQKLTDKQLLEIYQVQDQVVGAFKYQYPELAKYEPQLAKHWQELFNILNQFSDVSTLDLARKYPKEISDLLALKMRSYQDQFEVALASLIKIQGFGTCRIQKRI